MLIIVNDSTPRTVYNKTTKKFDKYPNDLSLTKDHEVISETEKLILLIVLKDKYKTKVLNMHLYDTVYQKKTDLK